MRLGPTAGTPQPLRGRPRRGRWRAGASLAALLLGFASLLAGCGGGDADYGAGDPGAAPPTGNVGFGGAQDIGQFRNILEAGGIPAANTLDPAGFFAEHYVELPAPECGQPLCLHSMLSIGDSWEDGSYQATLAIAMNTTQVPDSVEPRPRDLVLVVDTSGSMRQDDRLGYVRDGLNALVGELNPDDRVALISYSSSAVVRTEFDAERDFDTWRGELVAEIESLEADGSTNLYEGLQIGFEMASTLDAEREARVILLSDGQPTEGVTDEREIYKMAEEYLASGIGLTTIGVGLDFNIDLMSGLAERGAGNFYFLEDPIAAREVFTEELSYFVSPLAMDVTVEVRAGDDFRLGEAIGTQLWRTEGGVGSMHLPAVFVTSRTTTDPGDDLGRRGGGGTLYVAMLPTGAAGAEDGQVAEVRLRYRAPDSEEYTEQQIAVQSPTSAGALPDENYYSHDSMAKQYAMYNLYHGLHRAALAAEGDYHCALSLLQDLDANAEAWNVELDDADIAADRELIALFMDNLRQLGAFDVPVEQQCSGYYYDDDDYYDEYPDEGYYYDDGGEAGFGCSATGAEQTGAGAAMLLLWGLALLVGRRRRAAHS